MEKSKICNYQISVVHLSDIEIRRRELAMGDYITIRALRRGEVIDLEGIELKMDDGEIQSGDLYVGEGNVGPKLLTAKKIVMLDDGLGIDFVVPTCNAYWYDGYECVKVREA
jgi:hypothetical protein